MIASDQRRLAEIRQRAATATPQGLSYQGVEGALRAYEPGGDVPWLLDLVRRQEEEIAGLREEAKGTFRYAEPTDLPAMHYPIDDD